MNSQHGFVIIDKPAGITSHDVVAKLRRTLGTKQVGHAGTLDPMATGVLVIGINNATKFLNYIVAGQKRYQGTIRLGQSTTTDDREGEITSQSQTNSVIDDQIRKSLESFVGTIQQVPSSVSAIKVDGKRAYDRVRNGESVELAPREITIHSLDILEIRRSDFIDIDIDVRCSAGTYIRAIARDLGAKLGVGGHLTSLRRSEVAPFTLEDCCSLDNPIVRDLARSISKVLPMRTIDDSEIRELRFGRMILASQFQGVGVACSSANDVIAIIENREGGAQPLTVFNS
ncbi:MAG: tRNA pseudouridine(55) synthase TruB [Actinomycetales bacterium]|jgi:tRNA pseudouridine55 synthase|nr:tRNA pseudouridine(55) synthase TruB [Actinomycetales bacterium]